jgi:hypothetical protein
MTQKLSDDPRRLQRVRENIYREAHHILRGDWDGFSWHRSGPKDDRVVDADVRWSSQALCMSVWGTAAAPGCADVRTAIARVCGDPAVARGLEGASAHLTFELEDRELLNEKGTPLASNLDVVIEFDSLVLVVESKLSEPLGGCSQFPTNCSGRYESGSDKKTMTTAPCRLQVQDNKRTPRQYWTVMDALAGGPFAPVGSPCPFKGPGYQVMRNIASAARLGELRRKDWRVVFAFPFSLGGTTPADVAAVQTRLKPEHRARVGLLDYDALAAALVAGESEVARGLGQHIAARIAAGRNK